MRYFIGVNYHSLPPAEQLPFVTVALVADADIGEEVVQKVFEAELIADVL